MNNVYATTNEENSAILFSKKMVKKYKRRYPNACFEQLKDIRKAFDIAKPRGYCSPKVYAVKIGNIRGICFTVKEYDFLFRGVSGCRGKKCANLDDGFKFIYGTRIHKSIDPSGVQISPVSGEMSKGDQITVQIETPVRAQNIAYTDGSYSADGIMGWGYEIHTPDGRTLSHSSFVRTSKHGTSLIAELMSAMMAIDRASDEGLTNLEIRYDNLAVGEYAKSKPKDKNALGCKYHNFISDKSKSLNISFQKVKAHSGNEFNNRVDRMVRHGKIDKFIDMM